MLFRLRTAQGRLKIEHSIPGGSPAGADPLYSDEARTGLYQKGNWAVMRWRFWHAMKDRNPANYQSEVEVNFKLM